MHLKIHLISKFNFRIDDREWTSTKKKKKKNDRWNIADIWHVWIIIFAKRLKCGGYIDYCLIGTIFITKRDVIDQKFAKLYSINAVLLLSNNKLQVRQPGLIWSTHKKTCFQIQGSHDANWIFQEKVQNFVRFYKGSNCCPTINDLLIWISHHKPYFVSRYEGYWM